MAYQEMERTELNQHNQSALYSEVVVVPSPGNSDDYIIPTADIQGIVASITGTGALHVTFDPPSVIRLGTANFAPVADIDDINPAITGFRVVSTSGSVTGRVTLRTRNG